MSDNDLPKYPTVRVSLTNADGNAFAILGRVKKAMQVEGISKDEQMAFIQEASSGDYDHLLQTVMKWVEVE